MKKSLFFAALLLCGCAQAPKLTVAVENTIGLDRNDEIVEVAMDDVVAGLQLAEGATVVVLDADGQEVPAQVTADGKLIFPATVGANATAEYTIEAGTPAEVAVAACGRHYPERVDDIAWENDKVAFRAYGPALEASGERAFGYDVWAKNSADMVVEERYDLELNQGISYHEDHGNGLDCYKVGPTLGGGAAALLDNDGAIVYPYCYNAYEIIENGPLRFQVKMVYNPLIVNNDSAVVETRLLTLDKGSHLNKMVITYEGLTQAVPVITGLVIHPENPEAYVTEAEKGYIAYQDLTDNVDNNNGEIYVGAVFPAPVAEAKAMLFTPNESKELRGGATGHVVAQSDYQPASEYVYYWGNGWSKAGVESMEQWTNYLEDYAQKVRNPLVVTIK